MEHFKDNEALKAGARKNVFTQVLDLWKTDINWNSYTDKDRKICIWFGLSFVATIALVQTWLIIPATVSLFSSMKKLNQINVEE